ncbi:hypothetical protein EB001_08530 [bacterium]|nr:hypothetical protein [bacterium]
MPILSSLAAAASRAYGVITKFSSYINSFLSWGSGWKVTSGTWTAQSGTSKTSTSATSYPLAAVEMSKTNVNATLQSPQPGAGISLWVTDSGNWWGIVREQTVNNSYNCSTCTASFINPYFNVNATGNASNPYVNATGNASNPPTYGVNPSSFFYLELFNQKFYNPPTYNVTPGNPYTYPYTDGGNPYTFPYTYSAGGNVSYTTYDCNCSSSYPQSIKIIKSISGTVSTVTSWSVGTATDVIRAIKVITNGNGITIRPYSDTSATTQIGSDLSYTATGATLTTRFGIVVAPATDGQGSGTGQITIQSQ